MQVLSICPLKGGFLAVPQMEFDLGSFRISRTRRRSNEIRGLGDPICYSRNSHILLVANYSRKFSSLASCWSPKFDLRWGFFSDFSKLRDFLVGEAKRSSFSASFALAWALEQQAIGNEFIKDDSNSIAVLPEKHESEEVGCVSKVEVEDSEIVLTITEENGIEEEEDSIKNEKEVGKEKSARVDVRALARSLQSAKTADDVEEVLKDMGELPLPVYSSMIRGLGIDKKLESAIALVEWLKRKRKETNGSIGPNLFIYNSLLGAMKQSEQFGRIEKVMEDMAEDGILPNVVTYNTLMAIYLEQGLCIEALNVLEEIRKKGLSPSPVSYSTALLAYRRMEDGNGALEFFVQLREKYQKGEIGKDVDEDWENEFVKLENLTIRICYQVMRRWLVKGVHLSTNVLKLLMDMDKAGMRPGREEHERLVWACTLEGHYTVAKELYKRIREREPDISLSACNHVIWLMGKAKKWWAALEIYEDLLDKGPKPNNLSYELIISHFNILLTAASRRGIWRWGIKLLNKMEEKGLKPGSREWNAVLVACSKASEASAAVQIFRRMVEQGEKPTILSYGALLSALEKGKLYDDAHQVWDHMVKVGFKPNVYAYTILASVYIGQGRFEMVDSVIREMVSSGIEPTVVTFNAIISGCARNGMSSAAFEWFHRLKVRNISPNEITYEVLIEALAKDAKPRLAYELYLRARNEGLHLSVKAYDAIIQSSQDYGATIDISILGPRPPEKKKSVKTRKILSEFCDLTDVPKRDKSFDKEELSSPKTQVGDAKGWVVPPANDSKIYNDWASENRFRIGDTIRFKYGKDSVMVVTESEYKRCNSTRPIFFSNTRNTVFKLDRWGSFYFISGVSGHCKRGQRMIIKVMAPEEDSPPAGGDSSSSGSSGAVLRARASTFVILIVLPFLRSHLF
ncbi:hypothetical protein HHK36_029509 [Tetracentron sinense]|uniref:Phytocyanin domain-containing protein n=1 Tax=Tetracentron sinense TaxID=13715 RepID=A0A835CZE6_TETSI|nr:hypothetical protein HHK36_029509 [Tetracentron sinense]